MAPLHHEIVRQRGQYPIPMVSGCHLLSRVSNLCALAVVVSSFLPLYLPNNEHATISHSIETHNKDYLFMQLTTQRISRPWSIVGRLLIVVFGLFVFAVGDVFTYRADVGLGPWD